MGVPGERHKVLKLGTRGRGRCEGLNGEPGEERAAAQHLGRSKAGDWRGYRGGYKAMCAKPKE